MKITEFLLARIAEDEECARAVNRGRWDSRIATLDPDLYGHIIRQHPARVLAECEAKRRIVQLHEAWPVLVNTQPKMEAIPGDAGSLALRASQQFAWLTEQEYRARFGDEPPTAPMLRVLALPYADHPDCRDEWRP